MMSWLPIFLLGLFMAVASGISFGNIMYGFSKEHPSGGREREKADYRIIYDRE